jgi:hypothetical protein
VSNEERHRELIQADSKETDGWSFKIIAPNFSAWMKTMHENLKTVADSSAEI